jgi:hypothetical protein
MCGPITCVGASFIIFIVMLVFAIINIIRFDARNDFEDFKCNITKVEYPKEIPTNIYDFINDDFVKCDCGKRCVSDLGICSKIYIMNENKKFFCRIDLILKIVFVLSVNQNVKMENVLIIELLNYTKI